MNRDGLIELSYIVASVLFIIGLKMMSKPTSARLGNAVSSVGMLLAIVGTLLLKGISFQWIIVGAVIGTAVGAVSAYAVPMTAMPEMVGLFNGFGGLASLLVAWADYHTHPDSTLFTIVAIFITVLIGGITFSGSMVAFMKLAEWMPGRPILFKGQQIVNSALLLASLAGGAVFCHDAQSAVAYPTFIILVLLSLLLGITSVIPIGGADMPVVISLLNSYSGMAACAAGFVLRNNVLIVAGCLVGSSGIILTQIMCKAMNRSLANVLFSGFGSGSTGGKAASYKGDAKGISVEDAYLVLESANSVLIVPGYGMAVAQAQHAVRELGELLAAKGCEVKYGIHPVAGRMPGHMNVLLAEANVPYEQLAEPQDVNPMMATVDVAMVIGANDVVNPAAREDKASPIYGMPIINVDQAKTVFVLKRSMASGFAGIDNPLFFAPNTRMLFGDAKASVSALVAEFKSAG